MVLDPSPTNPLSRSKTGNPGLIRRWLTRPHPSISELESKRKAQFLASLSLILLIGLIISTYTRWNSGRFVDNALMLSLTVCIVLVYIFSRTPFYNIGSFIISFGCGIVGFIFTILYPGAPAFTLLTIISLAYLMGSILLPIAMMALLVLSSIVGMAILPFIDPSIPIRQMWTAAGPLTIMGFLFLVAFRFRSSIEHQQLEDIRTANRELVDMAATLEQRVAERTRELELAAEIGRKISLMKDPEVLLKEAVELICQRFNLYYTQIYLADSNNLNLILKAGTGEAGQAMLKREHRLRIDRSSIIGVAASERRIVVVEEVPTNHLYKYNPLLPDTHSEAAIPLLVGDRVVGTLDLQSSRPGLLTMDNLPAFEALAGGLAIAIENASLFAETERTRQDLEEKTRRLTQEGWQNFLDAVDHREQIIYQYDPQQDITSSTIAINSSMDNSALVTPISVEGVELGKFVFEGDEPWTEEDHILVDTVVKQVAQQLENIRLLAQAEGYHLEAEKAIRRMTHQGWEAYLGTIGTGHTSYIYDQNEVTTWKPGISGNLKPKVRSPLKIHGEMIGQLMVTGTEHLDQKSSDMVSAISDQLSTHLENLRLYASAQQELAERRRAEEALLKFRLALERSTDAVFMTDKGGVIIYVNPAFEKTYGYTKEEALGRTPRILKSGLIPLERYADFWGSLLNKQVVSGEIVNKHKDGHLIPIEGTNTPILDEQENILGFLAVHRDITERKEAQTALTKRATELETVARLSATVTALSDPLQVTQTVVDLAQTSFNLYHVHIYEMDEQNQTLKLTAGSGEVGRQMVAEGWEIPLDREQSLVARAARTRESLLINDVRTTPDFLANPLLPETRAEMAIPIIAGEKVLGVLDVQSDKANYFTQEDMNIQVTLAAQVAVALENAKLLHRTQSALAETETLFAITSAASRSLDLNETLQEVLDKLLAVMDYEAGLVSLVDSNTGRLTLAVVRCLPENLVARLREVGMEGTLCDLVFKHEDVLYIEDFAKGAPVNVDGLISAGFQNYLGVPVTSRGKVNGTICVFGKNSHQVQPSTLTLLQTAAQQVGIAIDNARLFTQVQRQADYEATINSISQKIQSTTTVESALQVAIQELGRALGAQHTSIHLTAGKPKYPSQINQTVSDGSNGKNSGTASE